MAKIDGFIEFTRKDRGLELIEERKKHFNEFLEPIREKRVYYENNISLVEESLNNGITNIKPLASQTIELVREKMKISKYIR